MTEMEPPHPEVYYLERGELVPNNDVPALVYRNVLPMPISPESAQALCEGNHWEKRVLSGPWDITLVCS